jgi:hypothetical protein
MKQGRNGELYALAQRLESDEKERDAPAAFAAATCAATICAAPPPPINSSIREKNPA